LCWTRTFGRRHGSRRDREARCSGGVLKSLAEGRGWRSIKRYRAHPLNDTRLEMDTRSPCGAIGERDDGGPFEGRRVGCHLGRAPEERFPRARPPRSAPPTSTGADADRRYATRGL